MNFEELLRRAGYIPIDVLGQGSQGTVFKIYRHDQRQILAAKIISLNDHNQQEWKSSRRLLINGHNIFILNCIQYYFSRNYSILISQYANMKTLDIIAKQPQIPLPSYTLRALMKQILEGIHIIHSEGFIHRDIKCDNILIHCPQGTGRVYVKISDFGFTKKEDLNNEQLYYRGTICYMAPEYFKKPRIITKKTDIYSVGITFYNIITRSFPVNGNGIEEQKQKLAQLKCIEKPSEITDNQLWGLLSQMFEFDPDKRISAEQALQHPFFTSPEAIADISPEQHELAQKAIVEQQMGNKSITIFDTNPSYIVSETVIKQFLNNYIHLNKSQNHHFDSSQNGSQLSQLPDKQNEEDMQNDFKINSQFDKEKEINQIIDKQQVVQTHDIPQQTDNQTDDKTQQDRQLSSSSQSTHISYYNQQIYSNSSYCPSPLLISNTTIQQQLQIEKQFLELTMTSEEIKENLKDFKIQSLLKRDIICINLQKYLLQDKQSLDIALENDGIIDILADILNNQLKLSDIYPQYYSFLSNLLVNSTEQQIKKMIQKRAFEWIKNMVESKDESFLLNVKDFFRQMLYLQNDLRGTRNFDLLLEELKINRTISKLIDIMHSGMKSQNNLNSYSAVMIIGILHKSSPIKDGKDIIKYLKQLSLNGNSVISANSLLAIICSSQNQENHEQILNDNYLESLNILLKSEQEKEMYVRILLLFINLLDWGTRDTKQFLQKGIELNRIKELSLHKNQDISNNSIELLKLIDGNYLNNDLTDGQNKEEEKDDEKKEQVMKEGKEDKVK